MARLDWEKANRQEKVAWSSAEVAEAQHEQDMAEADALLEITDLARRILDATNDGKHRPLRLGDAERLADIFDDNEDRMLKVNKWCTDHGVDPRRLREELRDCRADASSIRLRPGANPKQVRRLVAAEHEFQDVLAQVARRIGIEPAVLWSALDGVAGRQ